MPSSKTGLFAAVVAGFLLSAAPSAFGQQPSPADRETARSLMDEGDKKRDGGDLKGALKSYEGADAIMKVPTTGLEVARAQAALLMLLEARETLGRVVRIPAKVNEPTPFAAARKAAETLNGELAARIPSIQVNLTNTDANTNAAITIDNEPIPPAAAFAPRKVNPGAHTVVVKVGGLEKKFDVNLAEREAKTLNVDVKEKPPDPLKPPAPVTDEGDHTAKANPLPTILMFGGFGLAAVGVGVGSVTGIMSISKTSELQDVCKNDNCPPGRQGDIDDAKGLGNISTIAFIVGGLGLGAGIVGIVLSGKEKEKKEPPPPTAFVPVRVQAVVAPSYLGLTGSF